MGGQYLLAVISGVGAADQVLVGPAVQVEVLAADEAVPGVTDATLALVHGVTEVADEDALGVPVASVRLILAGI